MREKSGEIRGGEGKIRLKRRRGQTSLDFLIALGFLLLMGLGLFSAFSATQRASTETIQHLYGSRIARDIARGISEAWILGDGADIEVRIPKTMPHGERYKIVIGKKAVLVDWNQSSSAFRFFAQSVLTGEVEAREGLIRIKRENGSIIIT